VPGGHSPTPVRWKCLQEWSRYPRQVQRHLDGALDHLTLRRHPREAVSSVRPPPLRRPERRRRTAAQFAPAALESSTTHRHQRCDGGPCLQAAPLPGAHQLRDSLGSRLAPFRNDCTVKASPSQRRSRSPSDAYYRANASLPPLPTPLITREHGELTTPRRAQSCALAPAGATWRVRLPGRSTGHDRNRLSGAECDAAPVTLSVPSASRPSTRSMATLQDEWTALTYRENPKRIEKSALPIGIAARRGGRAVLGLRDVPKRGRGPQLGALVSPPRTTRARARDRETPKRFVISELPTVKFDLSPSAAGLRYRVFPKRSLDPPLTLREIPKGFHENGPPVVVTPQTLRDVPIRPIGPQPGSALVEVGALRPQQTLWDVPI